MANLEVDFDEQAQMTTNEIHCCCKTEKCILVAAVICEYKIHKN